MGQAGACCPRAGLSACTPAGSKRAAPPRARLAGLLHTLLERVDVAQQRADAGRALLARRARRWQPERHAAALHAPPAAVEAVPQAARVRSAPAQADHHGCHRRLARLRRASAHASATPATPAMPWSRREGSAAAPRSPNARSGRANGRRAARRRRRPGGQAARACSAGAARPRRAPRRPRRSPGPRLVHHRLHGLEAPRHKLLHCLLRLAQPADDALGHIVLLARGAAASRGRGAASAAAAAVSRIPRIQRRLRRRQPARRPRGARAARPARCTPPRHAPA